MAFWAKTQLYRRHNRNSGEEIANIHTPLVMLLSIVPGFGGAAYLASKPLRSKSMARLLFDLVGRKVPFNLYVQMRLDRWVAPRPVFGVAILTSTATEARHVAKPKSYLPLPKRGTSLSPIRQPLERTVATTLNRKSATQQIAGEGLKVQDRA